MRKLYFCSLLLSLFVFAGCAKHQTEPEPVIQQAVKIDSVSPAIGTVGTDILIKGSGFNKIASNNIVKIGAVSLIVKNATDSTLLVSPPSVGLTDKITVKTGTQSFTTIKPYLIRNSFAEGLLLKYISTSYFNYYTFNYTGNILTSRGYYLSPGMCGLSPGCYQHPGTINYFYDNNNNLIKEEYDYTPWYDNLVRTTDYTYGNGVIISDVVISTHVPYPFNVGGQPTSDTVSHTYQIVDKKLKNVVLYDAKGNKLSSRDYTYSGTNDNPQIIVKTDSVGFGAFETTYTMFPELYDPTGAFLPGPPRPLLISAKSAVSSGPGPNYIGTMSIPFQLGKDITIGGNNIGSTIVRFGSKN